MLSIKKRSKVVLSVAIASTLVIPAVAIAVNKINSAKDTFATAMPSGFNDQNFYNCVLAEFQTEYPDEAVASTGLTDGQLAKINTLSCSGENKSDAEKISSTSGVEKMTSLISLNLYNNKIQNLDVSNNPELKNLTADDIMVSVGLEKTVDGSASTAEINLTSVKFITNSAGNLTIKRTENYVFDRATAALSVSNLPATGGYVETEPILEPAYTQGKNFRLKIANISSGGEDSGSMPEGFNDQNFYNCVLTEFQTEYPDETVASTGLTDAQLAKVRTLNCDGENAQASQKIADLTGLNKMTGIQELKLKHNKISAINVANNTKLIRLDVSDNQLTSIDTSSNASLQLLAVPDNQITSLDVHNNTALATLIANGNQLTSLDLTNNTSLAMLYVYDNDMTSLDVSHNTKIAILVAGTNKLTTLNLMNNTELAILYVNDNMLTSLDTSKNTKITTLYANNNKLTSLNISNHVALTTLYAYGNQLESLNLSSNTGLTNLNIRDNQLSSLDVSKNTSLECLRSQKNDLTELDVSGNPGLTDLYADDIIIAAGIEDTSLSSGEAEFNLTDVKFISEEGNTTINNAAAYTYNSANKILTVNDFAATKGYVQTSPIDTSLEQSEYKNYKLKIGEVSPDDPDDPVDPDEPTDPDAPSNPSDKDSGSEDGADDANVPNTSGGKRSAKTPDTGAMRTDNNDSSSSTSYVLPVTIAVVVLVLIYVAGRKYLSRRRMNF